MPQLTMPPDCADAVRAALVAVATALAVLLAAGTLASALRRAVPALRPRATLDRLTLPVVRRLLDLLFAVALGASVAATPAGATAAPTRGAAVTHVAIGGALDVPVVRAPQRDESPPARHPTTTGAPSARPPDHALPTHVVERGDNLWTIARDELARRDGRPPARARDVARYWARVVEHNRARLRSGNPNLIFPGEVVELPA